MNRKVSYINVLKEALTEFDTSDTVEVKGPMLDPILSWQGGGELPTNKDAASILERYYYQEQQDDGVSVSEMEYGDDGNMGKTDAMKHGEGEGTEQAGTTDTSDPMDKREDDIAKEAWDLLEADDEDDDDEDDDKDEEKMEESFDMLDDLNLEDLDIEEGEFVEEDEDYFEEDEDYIDESDIEEEIINRLVSEMEDDELSEMEMTYNDDGVKPGMEAPKEKKMKDTEQHAMGSGTEQAGTGDAEGQIPPRKDLHDKMVKPKRYTDENIPLKRIAGAGGEGCDADYMEEAFELFKEEIDLDEDIDDLDMDDVRV